jgi:phage terminase large subunit-like protein
LISLNRTEGFKTEERSVDRSLSFEMNAIEDFEGVKRKDDRRKMQRADRASSSEKKRDLLSCSITIYLAIIIQ